MLLVAGAGYTTYSWNTGATTRFLWAKFDMKYKVTVTIGNSCGSDSTTVILLKGIEQINWSNIILLLFLLGSETLVSFGIISFRRHKCVFI